MAEELIEPKAEAALLLSPGSHSKHLRFAVAALGVIPWVGSIIAASAALMAEREQGKVNLAFQRWLDEHEGKFQKLQESLSRVAERVDALGDDAAARLNDDAFLPLVRRAYRGWDRAQSDAKRKFFERLLTNAAGTSLADDDVVRLFVDWIDRYDEVHFQIIAAVYNNPGITRLGIWRHLGRSGQTPREDSSEADLYRMLIHDLSTGRVIRQWRETDAHGRFLKKKPQQRKGPRMPASPYMKSSFDDDEAYQLSELGHEFVHYVLHEAVTRIEGT